MKFFDRLNLRAELFIGPAAMVLVAIGGVAGTLGKVHRNSAEIEHMTAHVVPLAEAGIQIQSGLNHSLAALRGRILHGKPDFQGERQQTVENQFRPALRALTNIHNDHAQGVASRPSHLRTDIAVIEQPEDRAV